MRRNRRRLALAAGALALLLGIEVAGWVVLPSWSIAASAVSPATPRQLWAWYADTRDWPHWDHLVDRVDAEGPFMTGTVGSSRSGGLSMRTELVEVREPAGYTERLRLPAATMTTTHVLTRTAGGTRIDHGIAVDGPGAWILFLVEREALRQGMDDALRRLATRAADGLPVRRIP